MHHNFTIHYKGKELPAPSGEDGEGHLIWEPDDIKVLDELSPFEFQQWMEILDLPNSEPTIRKTYDGEDFRDAQWYLTAKGR